MSSAAASYKRYRKLLDDFIALKSISTDSQYEAEMLRTAQWLKELFIGNGFKAQIVEGYGNPLVLAQLPLNPKLPTTLIYGHYDVQPADTVDGWQSEPFSVDERDGRLYGRGVVDNKGQVLIHIAAALELQAQGRLQRNLIFLIEGDEETGGSGVGRWLADNRQAFSIDEVLISDGEMPYKPSIVASFRGTVNATLSLQTAANNLHSGLYGGATPNAAEELAKIIAQLNDDDYRSRIPNFFAGQESMSKSEKAQCQTLDEERAAVLKHTGVQHFFGESFSARTGFVSMLTVSGFSSGYTGEGYSNIVPNSAKAKLNFRIAAGSNTSAAWEAFERYVKKLTPGYVELQLERDEELSQPIKVDVQSASQQAVIALLESVYGEKVLIDYCGATIPFVVDIKRELGVDPLLVSLANDDCNMHGVDENFDIGLIKKGLHFSEAYLSGQKSA